MPAATVDDGRVPEGSGRLTGAAEWFWYVGAAVGYVTFGIWHKWLLNWFLGPLWLVVVVVAGPAVVDRISGRSSSETRPPS